MEDARAEILSWFDSDGLMGTGPNPTPNSGGNELLETATAYLILIKLKQIHFAEDKARFIWAVRSCQVAGEPGIYNKNPGRPDQITFDDIIGVVAMSTLLCGPFQNDVANALIKDHNVLTNTGDIYWTAVQKPWNAAFYMLAADRPINIFELVALLASILVNAFSKDASSKRQTWLILEALHRKSILVDLCGLVWWWRLKATYGSIKRLLIVYYNSETQVLAKYCPI